MKKDLYGSSNDVNRYFCPSSMVLNYEDFSYITPSAKSHFVFGRPNPIATANDICSLDELLVLAEANPKKRIVLTAYVA